MSENTTAVSSKEQFDKIVRESSAVLTLFFSTDDESTKQIAAVFDTLARSLALDERFKFVKVSENLDDVVREHQVSSFPTFLAFVDGTLSQRVTGTNPHELQRSLRQVVTDLRKAGSRAGEGGNTASGSWTGADVPRGYSDITDQIEISGCELLNADEDAGPVKVLFETSKPSALDKGNAFPKDWVQSGADDQLLLFIPFQSTVKLHTVQLTSIPSSDDGVGPSRPSVLHLYINRPQNIDFDEAEELDPTQVITIKPQDWNLEGTTNIPLRFVKFQKTTTLILYVQKGDGDADTVRLDRLRLIGEAGAKREMGKLQKMGEDE